MKNFLSITVLFFLFSALCIPQSINSIYNSGGSILPQAVTLNGRLSASGEIPGQYKSPLLNSHSGSFRPVVTIEDNRYKTTYTYNSSGSIIEILKEDINNSSGSITEILKEDTKNSPYSSRIVYTYDELNRIKTITDENYNQYSGVFRWEMSIRYVYEYDTRSSSVSIYTEMKSDSGISRCPGRQILQYDEQGHILSEISEDMKEGVVIQNYGFFYSYDEKGNLLTYTYMVQDSGELVNNFRNLYCYDSGNHLTGMRTDGWKDGQWKTNSRRTYINDSEGRNLSWLVEILKDSIWENSLRVTNTYNNSDKVHMLDERFIGQTWLPSYEENHTYDNNHNCIRAESKYFSLSLPYPRIAWFLEISYNSGKDKMHFITSDSVEIEYSAVTAVGEETNKAEEFTLSQNYPNPFNPSTTINYSTGREGMVRLTVYDALGRMAAVIVNENKPAGSYSVKFDGSRYPSGVYFYRLESGGMTLSRKFVLIK